MYFSNIFLGFAKVMFVFFSFLCHCILSNKLLFISTIKSFVFFSNKNKSFVSFSKKNVVNRRKVEMVSVL